MCIYNLAYSQQMATLECVTL